MGWIISFPRSGNENRKYLYYTVQFWDRKNNSVDNVCLSEKVDTPEFEAHFPHTIGFFKGPINEKTDPKSAYLEIRVVNSLEEFWKFLNDLNI
jgi:hypothetical protein